MTVEKETAGGRLKFSIIIPTRNRAEILKETLAAFREMDFPREDYEIIVVDNGSTDHTRRVVEEAGEVMSNVALCVEERPGCSFARNTGLALARFQHIIFLDDDAVMRKSLLAACRRAWLKHPDASVIGGKIRARLEDASMTPRHRRMIERHGFCYSDYDRGEADRQIHFGDLVYGVLLSYKRTPNETKVFDTRFGKKAFAFLNDNLRGEDFELCTRIILQGKKVVYAADPDMEIVHRVYDFQFDPAYIRKRYYFAGIENYVMDRIHRTAYPLKRSLERKRALLRITKLFRPGIWRSIRYYVSAEWLTYVFSYYFNGRYFVAAEPEA